MIQQKVQGLVDPACTPYLGPDPDDASQHHRKGMVPGQKHKDEDKNDQVTFSEGIQALVDQPGYQASYSY